MRIKPLNCYHGGDFFGAIGTEFDRLKRRHYIIASAKMRSALEGGRFIAGLTAAD